MAFTVLQWFVMIFSIISLVKLVVVAVNRKSWFNVEKKIYGKSSRILMLVELILAALLFYYLVQDLTVTQIMASALFGFLVIGMLFAAFAKETIQFKSKVIRDKKLWARSWIPVLIIALLSVFALIEIF